MLKQVEPTKIVVLNGRVIRGGEMVKVKEKEVKKEVKTESKGGDK